jgi:endo-1,4-beta-xylanase
MRNDKPDVAPLTGRPPLRELAEGHQKRLGSAVNTSLLASDEAYRAVLAREFSSVTAENVMKWALVEPRRGVFDYTAADNLVEFARQHDQVVRGHTLVWHNQLPGWLTEAAFTTAELSDILHGHIVQEASHFRGNIDAWDVVNEPFNEDGTWRDSIWFRALGPDYVGLAFDWAQAADPQARLYLNDYNVESIDAKSDAMYTLVQDLLARGIPVQGVGFQAHLAMELEFPSSLRDNLERFAGLGLEVAITEADVRMIMPATPEKLTRQAEYFARLLRACLDVPRCVSFTVWGFADAHSWVPRAFEGQGVATLLDEKLQPKPAYTALSDVLRATVSP